MARWGGAVGAGLEFGFLPNWSVAASNTIICSWARRSLRLRTVTGLFPVGTDSIRQDVDLFTVRINYRLGGPVIGKY